MKCETCLHNEICRFNSIPTFGMDNVACQYEAHELEGEWIEGEIWEDTDGGWGFWQKCSICREVEHHKKKYCPNCGARMNVKETDQAGG